MELRDYEAIGGDGAGLQIERALRDDYTLAGASFSGVGAWFMRCCYDALTVGATQAIAQHQREWRAELERASGRGLAWPAPVVRPFPLAPSREQVCAVSLMFQGLTVQTAQFGALPWFEAALVGLSSEDRQAVYAQKHAVGDTHAIVSLGAGYTEPGQPYAQIAAVGDDFDVAGFVAEVIRAGFVPIVFLGGDDGERGYPVACAQLPRVMDALRRSVDGDLTRYVLIVPGWDGVFYGWTPDHITAFGQQFRALSPQGYLGLEHNTGHIPIGNGPDDWTVHGPMSTYDVLLSEFDSERFDGSVWQVAARCLGPRYRAPADQPAGDDPHPPWYLASGTPRGPYYAIAFEFDEYPWVRGRVTAERVAAHRQYFRNLGYQWVC